jgi:5'(3')-deoxyribonucleotidase
VRVAVDLDGPLYEFTKTARYMLRKYKGRDDLPDTNVLFKNFWPKEIDKGEWDWLYTEGVDLGLFRYGHMTKDARIGLEALRDQGHRLIVATARPLRGFNDTLDWITLYFKDIPLEGIFFEDKKYKVQADILIDDNWDNCSDWVRLSDITDDRRALLFDRPWNQSPMKENSGVYRMLGWEEVAEWFRMRSGTTESKTS